MHAQGHKREARWEPFGVWSPDEQRCSLSTGRSCARHAPSHTMSHSGTGAEKGGGRSARGGLTLVPRKPQQQLGV